MKDYCVIVDIDGTLANCEHRLHYIKKSSPDYDSFFAELDNDTLIEETYEIVKCLYVSGYQIVLCSGRQEKYRLDTIKWLKKYEIPWNAMYMRVTGDFRADHVIKRELLEQIRKDKWIPKFVIDDRQRVVDMWRKEGFRCFQCAPGDFDDKFKPGKLIMLVGPSGSGKSSYAYDHFLYSQIISSDEIREEICEDFQDQSKNNQVFHALHEIVSARIHAGLLTVVDCTNLRNADRRAILSNIPKDAEIEYRIFNRSMEDKIATGGWRNAVKIKGQPLMERHEEIFKSNIKDILAGDHDPRVTVLDNREYK